MSLPTPPLRAVIAVLALGLPPAAACCAAQDPPTSAPPNVLLILADDLGWADVPGFGADALAAPALARLAREGVVFPTAYAAASVCSPSRAALLTGRYPQRFGHENNTGDLVRQERDDIGLPVGVVTLADRMRARGYATGLVGKWHLGASERFHPLERGFDEFFGFLGGGHSYTTWDDPERGPILAGREPVTGEGYLTDVFADRARDFLERHRAEPFFLYLAFHAVHPPLEPPPGALDPDGAPSVRAQYEAVFTSLDAAVGRVLDDLDRLGLAERTLVVFAGDNGGNEENGASNGPFRAGKRSPYEGGLRVPLFVRFPGGARAGTRCAHPVSLLDVARTVLGPEEDLDGLDLAAVADAAEPPDRALFWRQGKSRAARAGEWKLVSRPAGGVQLFDLAHDPGEQRDLAADEPEVVARLEALYAAWEAPLVESLWEWR